MLDQPSGIDTWVMILVMMISIVIGRRRRMLTCMSETQTRPRLHLAKEVEADFSKS